MRQDKGELTNCPTNKKVVFGTRNNYNLASLHASSVLFVCTNIFFSLANCSIWLKLPTWTNFLVYVEKLDLSWFFVNCYVLFNRVVSLWHSSSRTCVISKGKVSLLDCYQTEIFLAVTGLWCSGKVNLLALKIFSNVIVTSHCLCAFLYLFSSANISPVIFVLHLQDWWCVGKRETSFPVDQLWLIYLLPSLWPYYKG